MTNEVQEFTDYLRHVRKCSEHTVRAYESDLRHFIAHNPNVTVSTLGPHVLRGYLAKIHETHSRSSIERKIASLRSFLRFLIKTERLTRDMGSLLRGAKAAPRPLPSVLTVDQVATLLNMPDRSTPDGRYDAALLEVLYGCGLRADELVGLERCDIDLSGGWVRVFGKGRKERMVPLGKPAIQALKAYFSDRELVPSARVFPITTRHVGRILSGYLARTDFGSGISPHSLRHSLASHLLANGCGIREIQSLLGHAKISTTQRYLFVTLRQLGEDYDSAHPLSKAV